MLPVGWCEVVAVVGVVVAAVAPAVVLSSFLSLICFLLVTTSTHNQ